MCPGLEDLLHQRVVPKGGQDVPEEVSGQHPAAAGQLVFVTLFSKYPSDHAGEGFCLPQVPGQPQQEGGENRQVLLEPNAGRDGGTEDEGDFALVWKQQLPDEGELRAPAAADVRPRATAHCR